MTQTEVIQYIREDSDKIKALIQRALNKIASELGGPISTDLPSPLPVHIGYDGFDLAAVQMTVSWIDCLPLVYINLYTWEILIGYNASEKERIDPHFKPYKWLGIKFYADGKVKFSK